MKYVFEIVQLASKADKEEEKIRILRANESWALKDVLRGTLDPKVLWNLPSGPVPFTACEEHNAPSNLLKENTKFKYFVKSKLSDSLVKFKREKIFLGILESIHPGDAQLLIRMINKDPIEGLSIEVVNKAFPNLIPT